MTGDETITLYKLIPNEFTIEGRADFPLATLRPENGIACLRNCELWNSDDYGDRLDRPELLIGLNKGGFDVPDELSIS